MGGANTNPQQQGQYETSQMMKRIEPINTPEMPYYGDAKPMAIPSNGKEPIRNMEYIKQEKALRESVRNLPEYTAVTPPPKPAATPIANEGPYMNSATADYPDVRGNTQNSQNRDTSVSEYMKAKTYNKPSAKQPIIKEGKYLNSSVADWPDERE
jgi:hypothetical protein